jgi:hypothetical protein
MTSDSEGSRIVVQELALTLELEWSVVSDSILTGTPGLHLASPEGKPCLHVRQISPPAWGLSRDGLTRLLLDQHWDGEPTRMGYAEKLPYHQVSATFALPGPPPSHVREWLVTDGKRLAHCTATDAPEHQAAACEAMVASLRFV